MKKRVLLCIGFVCLLSSPVEALRFGAAPTVDTGIKNLAQFLPSRNEPLERALSAHNLMTEVPTIRAMAEQQEKLDKRLKVMQKFLKNLTDCNKQRLGRYKNADEVLAKVRTAYKTKTKDLKDEEGFYSEDSIIPRSLAERNALWDKKKAIEQEIMRDALNNPKKWGGKLVDKRVSGIPDDLERKMKGTGLEELMMSDEGTSNAVVASSEFKKEVQQTYDEFLKRVEALGIKFTDFDATKISNISKVYEALQNFRGEKIEEAKEYINKLNEQDKKYPQAVARRTARTTNSRKVTENILKQFPEAFGGASEIEQQTPQQRQELILAAMEKDKNGTVFLTQTNVLEVDQKMAEARANSAMMKRLEEALGGMEPEAAIEPSASDFDFSVCS